MNGLKTLNEKMSWVCLVLSVASIMLLMTVTLADVSARAFFKILPDWGIVVRGSVEMVEYLLFFSMLSAMAASVEKSQVVVEAFSHKLGDREKARIFSFYLMFFMVAGLLLTWGLWEEAMVANRYGNTTQDLAIPMSLIYWAGAIMSALLAIRCALSSIIEVLEGGRNNES